jgi:hypothetical protein
MIIQSLLKIGRTTDVKLTRAKPEEIDDWPPFDLAVGESSCLSDERMHGPESKSCSSAEVYRSMIRSTRCACSRLSARAE